MTQHGGEVAKKQGGAGSESKTGSSAKGQKMDRSACVNINEPKQNRSVRHKEVTNSGTYTCTSVKPARSIL